MDRICSTMKQDILLMEAWDMKIKHTLNKDFRSIILRTFNRQIYIVNFQVLIIWKFNYLATEIFFLGIIVIVLHIDVQWNTIWTILFQNYYYQIFSLCFCSLVIGSAHDWKRENNWEGASLVSLTPWLFHV